MRACFILYLVSVVFSGSPSCEPTSYLSLHHRAYEFLEIMEHRGLVSGAHLGTKPITRSEAAHLLYRMSEDIGAMSPAEREEFCCLADEFSVDCRGLDSRGGGSAEPLLRAPGFLGDFFYANRRNLFSSVGEGYSLFLDPVLVRKARLAGSPVSSGDDNVYTSGSGFILRGTLGNRVGYRIDVRDSKEWGSRDYPKDTSTTMPGRGYASFKGDHAEFDETYAQITYSGGPVVVSLERGRNSWGRGRSGTLLMSDYGAPYDMMRVEAGFWKLRFVFFAGELKQFPPVARFYYSTPGAPSDSVEAKKYISGHRVEINFGDRLDIGLQESVVYGGRWESSYLNPLVFLKGAEHYNGDHDNAALGVDFRLFLCENQSIYGELLIDDITTTRLGTDWYGNKLAYQLGTFVVRPFGLRDVDSRIEYTRIDPWVYTHRYPINSYTHYGDVLGHRLGPNADEIFVELRKRFTRRFRAGVSYVSMRHGANPEDRNVGGDPLAGYRPGDSKKAVFLDGDLETYSALNIDVSYEILWELFLRAGYSYERYDGESVGVLRLSLGLNENR